MNTEVATQQEPTLAEYPEANALEKAEEISEQNIQQATVQAAEPADLASPGPNQTSNQAPDSDAAQGDADNVALEAEPEREIAKAFALPRLTEFGDNTIDLTFSEDCWFEIRTAQGDLLYADLGRSGQSRRYTGAAPFRLKVGLQPGCVPDL